MCHMIAAGRGIGVVPLAACQAQAHALGLKVLRLEDARETRQLLIATSPGSALSPAASLLVAPLHR